MSLPASGRGQKIPLLGTALWGWGVDRSAAFAMLDLFTALGGRALDAATNYPINKIAADRGVALDWVAEWARSNPDSDLAVVVKVGSVDNHGGDTTDLSATAIRESSAQLSSMLGDGLAAVAIHWDNRGDDDAGAVSDTLDEMRRQAASGLAIGFSGVRNPALYRELAPDLADQWWIQVRENAQSHAARDAYAEAFPDARYIAYGINMGGVGQRPPSADSSLSLRSLAYPEAKVAELTERLSTLPDSPARPADLAELAIHDTYRNPALSGVILGPRTSAQLAQSMAYWNRLLEAD